MIDAMLREVVARYEAVQEELARPETSTDPDALRRLGRELARLDPVVSAVRRLELTRGELAGAREMRDGETDEEIRSMARDEVVRLEADEARLIDELKVLLLPGIRPMTETSSWRSGRAPVERKRPCSRPSSSGCTSATQNGTGSRPTRSR